MDRLKKIAAMMALCILSISVNAQETAGETDFMYGDGKIWVVVAVVVTIVVGLFLYLLNLDRKIGKMERRSQK